MLKLIYSRFLIHSGKYVILPVFAILLFTGAVHSQSGPIGSSIPSHGSPGKDQMDNINGMTDIHDIKPLQFLGFDPTYIYYILLFSLFLTLCIIGWIIWKRKKRNIIDITPEIMQSPEEIALTALNRLSDESHGDGRLFYFELSAILRGYIQGRYHLNAPEMTSEELLPLIDHIDLNVNYQKDLKDFIRFADPIKFAAIPADGAKMKQDLSFSYEFVKKTTPNKENV